MKIGILTFNRAINYGGILQCYSLHETIKSMGHSVEIIDYRPDYIEKHRNIIPFYEIRQASRLIDKIKIFLSSVINIFSTIDARKRFDVFENKHFTYSDIVHSPDDIPQSYDVIFLGSDQIWSPRICHGLDPIYWGQFPHNATKLVAYAASMGGQYKVTTDDWNKIRDYLYSFDKISVREPQIQLDFLKKLDITSEVVVDPTILADTSIFERIAVRPQNIPDHYVLVYAVDPVENLYQLSTQIAKQTNCEIISITAKRTSIIHRIRNRRTHRELNPSIEEFLGLFKYANSIIVESFHGTVFSVLFKKDFYSIQNFDQGREQHFLEKIGLSHRLISTSEDTIANFHFEPVNYAMVDDKIYAFKQSSFQFIKSTLQNN